MKRRNFLRLTGLGALGGASLTWLPACDDKDGTSGDPAEPPKPADAQPGDVQPGDVQPGDALAKEVAAADALGRPTLVLLVPHDDEKWSRGTFFGTLLQNGGDELFRELATVHLVCATPAEVAAFRNVEPPSEEEPTPPAILIERSFDTPSKYDAHVVAGPVPAEPDITGDENLGFEDWDKVGDERYRKWVEPATAAIVKTIVGDAKRLELRAERVRKTLGKDDLAGVAACFSGKAQPTPELTLRAAAVFRADDQVAGRARWSRHLAAAARDTIVDKPIPGARWATYQGCGHEIDGAEEDVGVDCGMGFVPESGKRFLWLFTETG